ncbi:MAG: response regulator [Gemmatimonadaceae bacterium]
MSGRHEVLSLKATPRSSPGVLSSARRVGHPERLLAGGDAYPMISTIPILTGWVVLGMALVVLVGWAFDMDAAKTLFAGRVTVKVNTAIGLGSAAVCLLLRPRTAAGAAWRRPVLAVLAILVTSIGVLTIAEYVSVINLGIDELVFPARQDWGHTATPGRMAAVTSSAFVLLGLGLVTLDYRTRKGRRPSIFVLVATAALGLMALLAYVYGAIPTAGLGQGIQIAIPTAIALVFLSVGALAVPPHGTWVETLLSEHAGGMLARRLLPVAFLVPLALGGLRVFEDWTSQYSLAAQNAFSAVLTMVIFGAVVWSTAALLDAADKRRQTAEQERVNLVVKEEAARARADAERASRFAAEGAREQAERATKEKAEALTVLEIVLATAPVGFALFDREARYIRVNSTFAGLYGTSSESHIGRSPGDISPEFGAHIERSVREVVRTGSAVREKELAGDAGLPTDVGQMSKRHIMVSYYPLRASDGNTFAVGLIAVDTTELRMLEAQLAQSQKMEAIGQLAGGVAHDFNNLLTVIMSYSALLHDDFEQTDPRRMDVDEITAAARRASGLTRQLLAFSRKEVLQPRPTNVNNVVNETEKMLRRLIGEDIKFEISLQRDLGLINVDPGQVEQVLLNLAINARDAMPDGGVLRISTANANASEHIGPLQPGLAHSPAICLSVSDTGTGMSAEVQARAFEPFFTTKPLGKGTGLGLSTVYGIVKQLGGDVSLKSEPGRGTSFDIYLPCCDAVKQNTPPHTALQGVVRGSGTILLAEDDQSLRILYERVLASAGYKVLAARSGAHALELAAANHHRIDLAISDVVMPEMSGPEFIERLRLTHRDIDVLFVSGYTDDEVMKRGVLKGETAFLQKPFGPDQLLTKVREMRAAKA